MIEMQERVTRQEIFHWIRLSIQELHADKVILEDTNSIPFLFKTEDAQVWARIFYRSMRDYSLEELQHEIRKLWVLMPNDAALYLFYPELDREQILRMNGFSDRLSFFEYAGLMRADREKVGARICKWIPSSMTDLSIVQERERPPHVSAARMSFMQNARLTSGEIAGLAEISLALRRV